MLMADLCYIVIYIINVMYTDTFGVYNRYTYTTFSVYPKTDFQTHTKTMFCCFHWYILLIYYVSVVR